MNTVYIQHQDHSCTLTTFCYVSYWMSWAAEKLGYHPYINWPQNNFVTSYNDPEMYRRMPNAYNWYFVQDPPPEGNHRVWTWAIPNWNSGHDVSPYQFFAQPLADCKAYYKKTLKFNDVVEARGKLLQEKYQIDFSKTIGVTWRGTDIHLDKRPYLPIEVYFPWIDDVLEKNPDHRIICTAEETQILDPLLKRYNATIIEEFEQVPVGSKNNPERFSKRSGFERGLQPVLMVWLFSKCSHYIKNRSSTGMVASFISDGSITTLGADEKLTTWDVENRVPFLPIAERDGVQYPLYRNS